MSTFLRDHLWLWCHNPGVYNQIKALGDESDFTPVEAAVYLGIDNLIMVVYGGHPVPPFAPLHQKFKAFPRVVWSLIGDSSSKNENATADLQEVLSLQEQFPNVVGGIMDDFLQRGDTYDLPAISRQMRQAKLPLWVVVYTHELDREGLAEKLALCDVISFWTWNKKDLEKLPENLDRLRKIAPDKPIALGCYLWDFGGRSPMDIELMQFQCNLAQKWWQEKQINDIIILGSPLVGMNLPTIAWTEKWVNEVKSLER